MRKLEAALNVYVGLNILGIRPYHPAMDLLGKLDHPRLFLESLLQNLSNSAVGLDVLIVIACSVEESRAFDLPGQFLVFSAVEAFTLEGRVYGCDGDHVIVDGRKVEGYPRPPAVASN